MRRDVLTNSPHGAGQPEGRIELSAADHEEPTWEVRSPRRRRFDRRSRTILGVAALAAILANAGAAWAYWKITQPSQVAGPAPVTVDMVLRGRNDLSRTLRPGDTGKLLVTVNNDKNVPIRITSITMGPGNVVADPEHRDAGCAGPGVRMNRTVFPVSWEVARNTVGAFAVDGALTMPHGVPKACIGATFTVPLRADGVQR
ncbi:hypothetical protein Acy02nite_41260 [Actinoplanes cyaneus]|uniref:Uncharacterized protein n=1 Tax=Actinoplanes cyaneus TaxID=52696 RepID=A0A919M1I6_9ACTN|nr:hypothetical protein [Actinoplanes cyaneus]MCW2138288.1 hypothetical protein [Actinoplanes cyaneus]GID66245.1 hypothetical protein Acy02nite_41260 [Actinoplanes cyaneus]